MGELFNLFERPEFKAARIQELADIDMRTEQDLRRAENIRRALGLIGIEKGITEEPEDVS